MKIQPIEEMCSSYEHHRKTWYKSESKKKVSKSFAEVLKELQDKGE